MKIVDDNATLVCTYKLVYRPDSTILKTRTENYKLLLGKHVSLFQGQGSRLRDSLTDIVLNLPANQRTSDNINFYTQQIYSLPQASLRCLIYKIPASERIIYYDWIEANLYQYEEPTHLLKWIISPHRANIGNYSCQKATTSFAGRRFEAWFTREIPISDGPYKFYGLPGLIIKVADMDNQYLFELTKIAKITAPTPINLPKKYVKTTTREQFQVALAAHRMQLADRMAAMGNNVSAEKRQMLRRQN